MPRALLLSVRFHDGRYHGAGDWPPAPARLFQALVAGAAGGHTLPQADKEALTWLETLEAPVIAAPIVRDGQGFTNYVPNNDLDAIGGDPGRIGEIRAPKMIRPRLFDAADTLLYAWNFEEGDGAATRAQTICAIAQQIYQLGRGVDMAWAWAEVLDGNEMEPRLARHGGVLYRHAQGGAGETLLCPQRGSLASLEGRFRANRERFPKRGTGNMVRQLFSQAPKPRFASVVYNSPPQRFLFDLRQTSPDAAFAPWPFARTAQLVEILRDAVAERLKHVLPEKEALIERVLIGRGATEADKAARARIVPLPSIGSPNTDPSIRRVLVEISPNCPIPAVDISWGFSVVAPFDRQDSTTGEVLFEGPRLSPSLDQDMLRHYGIEDPEGGRLWRTITPAALPKGVARRRIDPSRLRERSEQKSGAERRQEEERAAGAVNQALRHAGIGTRVEAIRVQREPFERKGKRAEAFANETRFAKEQLWHVELAFANPVRGPIVLGDGRYLGLGLMAPVKEAWRDAMVFTLLPEPRVAVADRVAVLRAVRRALMALSRNSRGDVPRLFSGHEADGAPASSGRHEHVFLAAADLDGDGRIERLIVAAPWVCDHSFESHPRDRALFDRVVSSLELVRAGKLGVIALGPPAALLTDDPLIGPACVWESCTLYHPTRHARRGKDPAAAVVNDVLAECRRRHLPNPKVELLNVTAGPNNGGVGAHLRLHFAVAVEGPIMLGAESHRGGGLFEACRGKT